MTNNAVRDGAGNVILTGGAAVGRKGYDDSYIVVADAVALAQNKSHLSIMNASDSGVRLRMKELYLVNNSLTAVTGVAARFDIMRATAHSSGTDITPRKLNTQHDDLPVGVTIKTGATVTDGALLMPYTTNTDEVTAANTAVANFLQQLLNILPNKDGMAPLTLNPGEGFHIKQITNTIVGSFSWVLTMTAEPI
jgi:hypothetical protein